MADAYEPTVDDHSDQPGEALDAAKLPEEFPDKPVGSFEHGVTPAEQARGESLDDKLQRESRPGEDAAGRERRRREIVEEADMGGGADVSSSSGRPRVPTEAEVDAIDVRDDAPGAVDRRPVRPEEETPGR